MNLTGAALALGFLARPVVRVRRPIAEFAENGRLDQDHMNFFERVAISAVVQAATEQDLRMAPEGERLDGYVTIWTTADLRTADEQCGALADVIETPEGPCYRIYKVAQRTEGGFTRAIGRLVHDGGRGL